MVALSFCCLLLANFIAFTSCIQLLNLNRFYGHICNELATVRSFVYDYDLNEEEQLLECIFLSPSSAKYKDYFDRSTVTKITLDTLSNSTDGKLVSW